MARFTLLVVGGGTYHWVCYRAERARADRPFGPSRRAGFWTIIAPVSRGIYTDITISVVSLLGLLGSVLLCLPVWVPI